MVELHSPPGRYTLILYLADYVNTLILLWFILDNNTNPSWFSHLYTWKVLLPPFIHYHHDPTLFLLCNKTLTWLRFIIYEHPYDYTFTSGLTEITAQTAWWETLFPRGRVPRPRETGGTRSPWLPEHVIHKVAHKCILMLSINESRGKTIYTMECHITPPPPQHKRAPKISDHSKVYPKYLNGNLHMKRNRCKN